MTYYFGYSAFSVYSSPNISSYQLEQRHLTDILYLVSCLSGFHSSGRMLLWSLEGVSGFWTVNNHYEKQIHLFSWLVWCCCNGRGVYPRQLLFNEPDQSFVPVAQPDWSYWHNYRDMGEKRLSTILAQSHLGIYCLDCTYKYFYAHINKMTEQDILERSAQQKVNIELYRQIWYGFFS